MKILLTPQRSDAALAVSKSGDALTINGEVFDFSVIPDGATLPAAATGSGFFAGDISRVAGQLIFTLILPHGANPSAAVSFPAVLDNPPDGPLELPQ